MTFPFVPLVSATELGTYLNDSSIDPDRAAMLIEDAQVLCQTIVNPLPDQAGLVVRRVAGRAYVTITSARAMIAAAAAAGMPGITPGGQGGIYLTRGDKADLRRMASGGGAFSIDTLPAGYSPNVPLWDSTGVDQSWDVPPPNGAGPTL